MNYVYFNTVYKTAMPGVCVDKTLTNTLMRLIQYEWLLSTEGMVDSVSLRVSIKEKMFVKILIHCQGQHFLNTYRYILILIIKTFPYEIHDPFNFLKPEPIFPNIKWYYNAKYEDAATRQQFFVWMRVYCTQRT